MAYVDDKAGFRISSNSSRASNKRRTSNTGRVLNRSPVHSRFTSYRCLRTDLLMSSVKNLKWRVKVKNYAKKTKCYDANLKLEAIEFAENHSNEKAAKQFHVGHYCVAVFSIL